MKKHLTAITLILILTAFSSVQAADWSRFRGPNGTGVDDSSPLPEEFGPDKNILWKIDLPSSASSPVFAEGAVFVTASDEENLIVQRINAKTGKLEWKSKIKRARNSKIHVQNDSASPTPVVDGENLYAFFQELGVVSFDLEGSHRWTLPLEPFKQFYGMSGSPILTKDLVILQCDQQQNAYLIAINKSDGTLRWKADRSIRGSSWTTPVAFPSTENASSIIVHGNGYLDAYLVEDGTRQWASPGYGSLPTTSPFLNGAQLFATAAPSTDPDGSGFQLETFEALAKKHDKNQDLKITKEELKGNLLAGEFGWGDMDKDGFISQKEYETIYEEFYTDDYGIYAVDLNKSSTAKPELLWQYRGSLPYITTPVLYRNIIFFVDQKGYLNSIDAANGEPLKRERIPGLRGQFYASLVAGDGKIYVAGLTGKVAVLSAEADWQVISVNDLDDRISATPALSNGHLYIRTKNSLYCFGK